MTYTNEMVLPRNFAQHSEDEMMYLDGGATTKVNLKKILSSSAVKKIANYAKGVGVSAIISGTWLLIKYNATTSYTKTVTRQGKKYTVQYSGKDISKCAVVKVIDFVMDWFV